MKGICIFIPAYNEEQSVAGTVLLAKKYGKVVVVDDGSDDRTAEIAEAAGAAVIRRGRNGGYGAALKTAIAEARKSGCGIAVFMDADFQHNPDDIPKLAAPIAGGKADVVLGSRFLGKFENAPIGRKEGVAAINALASAQGGGRALDYQCGFRAFSKRAVSRISISHEGYSACSEAIISAQKAGMRVSEVPVAVRYFASRNGSPLEQAARLVAFAVSEIVKRKPLLYFGGLGALLIAASALLGIYVVETIMATRSLMVGSALLTVFFGIAGLVLVLIGINLHMLGRLAKEKGGK